MVKKYIKTATASLFLLMVATYSINAADVTMSVTTTAAGCKINGSITISLSGADVGKLEEIIYTARNTKTGAQKQSSSNTIPNLEVGSYDVSVSAHIGEELVSLKKPATIAGNANYKPVTARVISKRPALPNLNTGQIKFEITNGSLPYTVEVTRNSQAVKSITFTNAQKDYLIDGLSDGDYQLQVTSAACSDDSRTLNVKVDLLSNPYNCSLIDPPSDLNNNMIFDLNNGIDDNYKSEHLAGQALFEYCYSSNQGAYSNWADLPTDGKVVDKSITSLCDGWNKNYVFKVRLKDNPNVGCTSPSISVEEPKVDVSHFVTFDDNGCTKDTFLYVSIGGKKLYTPPVKMEITDLTDNKVLITKTFNSFSDGCSFRFDYTMFGHTIEFNGTDAKGCQIDKDNKLRIFRAQSFPISFWTGHSNNDSCKGNNSDTSKHVGVQFKYLHPQSSAPEPPDGTIVTLRSAPDPSLCFSATYDRPAKKWSINPPNRLDVIAKKGGEGLHVVQLIDTTTVFGNSTLPSGTYTWVITNKCGRSDTIDNTVDFYRYQINKHLTVDSVSRSCSGVFYYPKDEIVRYRLYADANGNMLENAPEQVKSTFQVYSDGIWQPSISISPVVNEGAIELNPQYFKTGSTFEVRSFNFLDGCPLDNTSFQYSELPGIELLDAGGYKCPGSSLTKVNAKVDSTTGNQPYTFTLYDRNKRLIDSNQTGVFALSSAPDTVVLRVTDRCNESDAAWTVTNRTIPILPLNGSKSNLIAGNRQSCVGNLDSIYGRLFLGNYKWTLPDGSTSNQRKLFHRFREDSDEGTGVYKLEVTGLDCPVSEQVTLSKTYPYTGTLDLSVCTNDSIYTLGDTTFNVSTAGYREFTIRRRTQAGCDSVVTVKLDVCSAYHILDTLTIHEDDLPYDHGNIYFDKDAQSGEYPLEIPTVDGCDSIYALQLTVKSTITYLADEAIVACANDKLLLIDYKILQGTADTFSLFFDSSQGAFEDIISHPIVPSPIAVPIPANTKPGEYDCWLVMSNPRYESERLPLKATIKYPASIIVQKWNDVLALYNEKQNGGYTFSNYQWQMNDTDIEGATGPYLYAPPALDFTAEYSVMLTRQDDGATVATCPVVPRPKNEISLYPNVMTKSHTFNIITGERSSVIITGNTGRIVSRRQVEAGKSEIQAPDASGIYLIEVKGSSSKQTFKIVVQ